MKPVSTLEVPLLGMYPEKTLEKRKKKDYFGCCRHCSQDNDGLLKLGQ